MQLDYERVRDLLHNVTLDLHLIRLICAYDEVFLERLHGENLVAVFLLRQVHLAK